MPKKKFKTVRLSEDEIRDATETARRQRKRLSDDQILVHLDTGPLDFSDEDDDKLDDLEVESSSEEEEDGVVIQEIKEVELPTALDKVPIYLIHRYRCQKYGTWVTLLLTYGTVSYTYRYGTAPIYREKVP